jgi:hypothetical protein
MERLTDESRQSQGVSSGFPLPERFSSRGSFGDSSKTQIPFGNDKQKGATPVPPSGRTDKKEATPVPLRE